MTQADLATEYRSIWQTFTERISQISEKLINADNFERPALHELLKSLQFIPYLEAPALFAGLLPNNREERKSNIGSVTGVFFELIAASIIKGYISKHVAEAEFEFNKCSIPEIRVIARDPDVFIHYRGRHVVFELKTSPKRVDLDKVVRLHEEYGALGHTKYFLVGGHVSIDSKYLEYFANEKWACFTSASDDNETALSTLPVLDDLLLDAVNFLHGH